MEQRGAAREAGGGPCDGASSPVVQAHDGRVTHASSGRPVEPAAGVLSTQPAKWLCALEGTAPHGRARAVSLVAVRRCGLAAGVPGRPPALIALGVRSAGTCEGQQRRLRATARGRRDHGGRAHAHGHEM